MLTKQKIADAQAEIQEKEVSRLIVAWNPGCLKSLPQKIPPSLQALSVREAAPLEVFGEKDSAVQGRKVILRGGVYMQDRVGANELQVDSTREIINGRHLALWLFARAVGLHARLGLTLTGCLANCRDRLRLRFLEGPSMRAAYYGTLNTDILRISNSHLPPPRFLPTIRKVAESLSEGSDEAREALGKIITAAVACVDEISVDRKVDVQRLAPTPSPLQELRNKTLTVQKVEDASAEPSAPPQILRAPSGLLGDPFQMRQWYLHSFFGNFTVEADKAWQKLEMATRTFPVVLAVLDTGCYLHQDFIDDFDVASSIFWDNPGEKDCTDGIDDDENGYVDDCFGWVDSRPVGMLYSLVAFPRFYQNFVEDNAHPFTDDSGHGTLVTSVAAARAHDGRGGRGVFSNPTVMCLRVGSQRGVWTSTTIPALDYAIRMNARVSNHSYGGPGFVAAEYEAFVRALKHDHLIVTAAGNSGCNIDEDEGCYFTPGAFRLRGLVNVMASDVAGFRASFSNYGSYTYVDGTSFAAPIVAGMAASLWAYFEATNPLGWQQGNEPASRKVEQAIMYSVTGSKALAGEGNGRRRSGNMLFTASRCKHSTNCPSEFR
ncbi:subtilase family serine protease, putative [Eimeria brunetti]|uniref:subtilisin n=1 Tax=Eimeria brunetti TaxID=51314 RepID=U6LII5_9EIME|nr:subtilase family serine protease, putative [Eimeria brunetti]